MAYSEYRSFAIANTEKEEPKFDAVAYGCQYPDLIYEVDDSGKNYKNSLDLYLPKKRHGKVPLLIYIHGGAFTLGTKRCSIRPLIMRDYGYAVAMVEYTKATEEPFPTQIRQIKQAIAFLRENASKYGYAENQIAAYGESAGGNLAAQYYSSLYLGGFMQEFPELVPPTNPETYLTSKCPPFFIQHGMKHELPYLQAVKFADKLKEKMETKMLN